MLQQCHFGDYIVKPGDTLWSIAKNKWGNGGLWWAIAEHNHLLYPERIFAGQVLRFPEQLQSTAASRTISQLMSPHRTQSFQPAVFVAYPVLEWDLAKAVRPIERRGGLYRSELKLVGTLKIRQKGVLECFTIKDFAKIVFNGKVQADGLFKELVNTLEFEVSYFKQTFTPTVGLLRELKTPVGSFKCKISTDGAKLKFQVAESPVSGEYKGHILEGKVGFELTVEPEREIGFWHREPVYVPVLESETSTKIVFFTLVLVTAALAPEVAAAGLIIKWISDEAPFASVVEYHKI